MSSRAKRLVSSSVASKALGEHTDYYLGLVLRQRLDLRCRISSHSRIRIFLRSEKLLLPMSSLRSGRLGECHALSESGGALRRSIRPSSCCVLSFECQPFCRFYLFVCSSLLPRNLIAWCSSRNQNQSKPRETNETASIVTFKLVLAMIPPGQATR